MKKVLCLILAVLIVSSMGITTLADENIKLSEMSDEECLAFLKERDVHIPEIYEDEIECVPFVRTIIEEVEENPNIVFTFGYTVLWDFSDSIKHAVNEYYGIAEVAVCTESQSNILRDNTVYGSWKSEYANYNCYAYVIGLKIARDPGQIKWIRNGNSASTYIYNQNANIYTIAGWVKDDLESLGYTVSTPTTIKPSTDVSDHTNLICVRKDEDGYSNFYDYHFMKCGEDGKWYHKPGRTNLLKYIYTPSNSREWVSEGYDGTTGVYFRYEDFTYDSTIYYIEFTTPHSWYYKYSNGDTHTKTCSICGVTSGSPLSCVYVNNICKSCGHNKVSGSIVSSLRLQEVSCAG